MHFSGKAAVAQIDLPKCTARDAEVELSHLEAVFRSLARDAGPSLQLLAFLAYPS